MAIEQSMLGATHACANPLTARYGTTHGVAIAVMLPHVVRWNAESVGDRYAELLRGAEHGDGTSLPMIRRTPRRAAGSPGWPRRFAADAPRCRRRARRPAGAGGGRRGRWTGTFNPRQFDAAAALSLYERASTAPPATSSFHNDVARQRCGKRWRGRRAGIVASGVQTRTRSVTPQRQSFGTLPFRRPPLAALLLALAQERNTCRSRRCLHEKKRLLHVVKGPQQIQPA